MQFNVTSQSLKLFIDNENVYIGIPDITECVLTLANNMSRLFMRTPLRDYVLYKSSELGARVLLSFLRNVTGC